MFRVIITLATIAIVFGSVVVPQQAHQSAEIGLAIGRMISDLPEKPRFNPGDEFAKP